MEGDILLYRIDGCSHSLLFGLEGRAPFAGLDGALRVDSMVTGWANAGSDAATTVCVVVVVESPRTPENALRSAKVVLGRWKS